MMLALIFALASEQSLSPVASCYFMTVDATAGEVIDPSKASMGSCPQAAVPARLVYDRRAAVARAAVDLEAGTPLGAVYLPDSPAVLPGQRLVLTERLGRVSISREVTALQGGNLGRWLFVRDDAGIVFKARLSVKDLLGAPHP
jgi:flagella basal body P-ring formation protein FlgA